MKSVYELVIFGIIIIFTAKLVDGNREQSLISRNQTYSRRKRDDESSLTPCQLSMQGEDSYLHNHQYTRHQFMSNIFDHYDKTMRPPTEIGVPVDVTFSLTFMQLLNLDAKAETIKSSIFATFYWVDKRLAFNHEEYGLDCDVLGLAGFPIPPHRCES